MKPSHKQISLLSGMLKSDQALQKNFDMEGTQERLTNITTYNLYRYILFLYLNKHRSKLNTILAQLGFKAKKNMNTQIKFNDEKGIWVEETERDENEKLVYKPIEDNNEFPLITPINIIIQTR